jgi:hypothetical protein
MPAEPSFWLFNGERRPNPFVPFIGIFPVRRQEPTDGDLVRIKRG